MKIRPTACPVPELVRLDGEAYRAVLSTTEPTPWSRASLSSFGPNALVLIGRIGRLPNLEGRASKLDDCGQCRDPCGDHYPHADCQPHRQSVDLSLQLAPHNVEIVSEYAEIVTRRQLGHDKLPRGFGVRLRLILRNASVSEVLRITEAIESKRNPILLSGSVKRVFHPSIRCSDLEP